MKKKRLFLIVLVSILFVFVFLLGSPIFKLQNVEIKFFNDNNQVIFIKDNLVFNNKQKINKIISSGKFDYGNSLFLINKENYVSRLDKNNPYLKLIKISSVFPNKIIVYARERKPVFYISNDNDYFLLDREFKILEITQNNEKTKNLIYISAYANNKQKTFFEFFNISNYAYEESQYLYENNLIISSFKNIVETINNFSNFNIFNNNIFENLIIFEKSNYACLKILTKKECYGLTLEIENVLENFDRKLHKLLCALKTLYKQEKIKTTYGVLSINNSFNCFWNNL